MRVIICGIESVVATYLLLHNNYDDKKEVVKKAFHCDFFSSSSSSENKNNKKKMRRITIASFFFLLLYLVYYIFITAFFIFFFIIIIITKILLYSLLIIIIIIIQFVVSFPFQFLFLKAIADDGSPTISHTVDLASQVRFLSTIMGLAASSTNYKTQNEDEAEQYSDDGGSINNCGNDTGMFDLSDKHTICSVSQYLRILMSDKMLNEHIDMMDMPPQIVGIDDIEWRSPYAKNRFEDIQMLESAGNLPQADKYYTGALGLHRHLKRMSGRRTKNVH